MANGGLLYVNPEEVTSWEDFMGLIKEKDEEFASNIHIIALNLNDNYPMPRLSMGAFSCFGGEQIKKTIWNLMPRGAIAAG